MNNQSLSLWWSRLLAVWTLLRWSLNKAIMLAAVTLALIGLNTIYPMLTGEQTEVVITAEQCLSLGQLAFNITLLSYVIVGTFTSPRNYILSDVFNLWQGKRWYGFWATETEINQAAPAIAGTLNAADLNEPKHEI
jgi:hypothetical protein